MAMLFILIIAFIMILLDLCPFANGDFFISAFNSNGVLHF